MASVTKRRWKKPDGSTGEGWQVRYVDAATGKRPGKMFDLKKDADAFKRKVEREIEDGTHVMRSQTKSMADVLGEFVEDTELRWRDGRIGQGHCVRQEQVCRRYFAPAFGKVAARDLTANHVSDLYAKMVKQGLKPRSVKQYLNTLQMVERFARKRGYLKTQPVTDAMSDLRGIPAFRVEIFQADEVTHLLTAAPAVMKGRPLRTCSFMGAAVALASLCGLRAGEILGLHECNVDLQRRIIRVRHNLTLHRELKGPKTAAGVRDVPIPARAAVVLEHWAANFQKENVGGYFFSTTQGKAYTYGALHEGWKRMLIRENVATRHFHALRHFYASWLLKHGMPVADVSKLLGHSSHEMTLRVYTHAMMNSTEAVTRVEAIAQMLPANDALVTHGRLEH
ncbi:site-specific integrase [Sphingomonas sp. PsM26]|nr:site-specific integrase [Sphingomonas sp. PsM26]